MKEKSTNNLFHTGFVEVISSPCKGPHRRGSCNVHKYYTKLGVQVQLQK